MSGKKLPGVEALMAAKDDTMNETEA